MALSFTKFYPAIERIFEAGINCGSDTFKIALSNTAPTVSDDDFADITEISSGNGYTTGGESVTISTALQTNGTYAVVLTGDVVITASGGSIGPFQYFILYDDTHANDALIGYWDYGSAITLTDGNSVTLNTDGTTLITAS